MSKAATHRLDETGRPTIYDVAHRAEVSPATVSKVLSGVTTVGKANAARVLDAVRALDYRRDPLAANLRRGRRSLIGLIIPDFKNPFFGALISAIEQCSAASEFELVTVSSGPSGAAEARQIAALLDWRVAGMIVIPSSARFPSRRALQSAAVPTVLLDRISPELPFDGVGVDNDVACARMVGRFYDAGHRTLLVAASTPGLPNMRERIAGTCASGATMPEPMQIEVLSCGNDLAAATQVVADRFAEGPQPTAVFTLFIEATLAVLREVNRRGLSIPGALSLAGFDDFEWLQVMHPPIATVVQPIEAMAVAAWERLMQRIETPEPAHDLTRVPCQLDFRSSIAGPPSKPRSPQSGGPRIKPTPQRRIS